MDEIYPQQSLEIIELRFENFDLKEKQTKNNELIQQLVDALHIAHYGGGEDLQEEIPIRALGAAKFAGYSPVFDSKEFKDRGWRWYSECLKK